MSRRPETTPTRRRIPDRPTDPGPTRSGPAGSPLLRSSHDRSVDLVSAFEIAVAAIFFSLVLFRLVLIGVVGFLIIRPVRDCPACFEPTVPIRLRWLARVSPRFEWRWCPECGWEGPARRAPRRSRQPAG
jgi:hypothetical protein